MGLYDNFADTQVKVFSSPCNILHRKSEELNDVALEFYSAGGKLRHFSLGQKVPYATPFYCYGKNFIILDFFAFAIDDEDTPQAIFIRNGRFYAKKDYDKVNKGDMEGISLIVNRYGNAINVKTPKDMIDCVREMWGAHERYNTVHNQYLKELGVEDLLTPAYRDKVVAKEISHEQLVNDCKKADEAREKAASETLDVARSKWLAPQDDKRTKMINDGYEFGFVYFQLVNENNHQWEKKKAIQLLKEKYAENYSNSLEAYINWIKENCIDVKEKDVRETFKEYDKEITKELEEEYLTSEMYQNATFIYRINRERKV